MNCRTLCSILEIVQHLATRKRIYRTFSANLDKKRIADCKEKLACGFEGFRVSKASSEDWNCIMY